MILAEGCANDGGTIPAAIATAALGILTVFALPFLPWVVATAVIDPPSIDWAAPLRSAEGTRTDELNKDDVEC